MRENHFFIEKIRFHLSEENTVSFVGWYFDGHASGRSIEAYLDGRPCRTALEIHSGAEVRQKYLGNFNEINDEVIGMVKLPENWKKGRQLVLFSTENGVKEKETSISVKKLCTLQPKLDYYIESAKRAEQNLLVLGWCVGAKQVSFTLLDEKGNILPTEVSYYHRRDLKPVFPEQDVTLKPGFQVKADLSGHADVKKVTLIMEDGKHRSKCTLSALGDEGRLARYMQKAGNAFRYLERNGISATVRKVNTKLGKKEASTYEQWREHYEVKPEELETQRQTELSLQPFFSIVVPLYRTNEQFLREMMESILAQTYTNWELCMADGSADGSLDRILQEYAKRDKRIRYVTLAKNEGISGNTNRALAMAEGDYIVLVDHDDLVPANALFEFASALNEDSSVDVIYSDEDKVSMNGKKFFEPHFKSDFNVDLLCSMNYICHLFAVKRSLQQEIGVFDPAFDGAQDYDFIFRCCEQAKNIRHIPKILYHWRCHMESTAANPESKLYAFEAGKRAIEAHYRRAGIPARVEHAQFYGMYHTIYEWKEEPLVSIIIPNKDHIGDLEKCMNSIYDKTDYHNFEFVIVENNSTEPETFEAYKELEKAHDNVTVVYYDGDFNYSKINNFGVERAHGDYLLLLNNDTEAIHPTCIREMLGYCMRDDVGIVGARLYYEDDTIQHAGVVIGFSGIAGHCFINKSRYDTGYFGRIVCAQDYSAVTAACLMTKRSVYEEVGGLDESFKVAFNDIDYCLKVRQAGKLVVYNPYAELYHYESKSRGLEDTPEKIERFNREIARLNQKWPEYFEKGDPYYNKNLTLDNSDFSLRR